MTNKQESNYIRPWANKIRAVNMLGGKCSTCGNDNIFCLQFHHVTQKNVELARLLDNRWSNIIPELKNCILLCTNCHNEKHDKSSRPERITRKLNCLKYLNIEGCERCGYFGNTLASLEFHHLKDKKYEIPYIINRPKILSVKVLNEELDKCIVLCSNCHVIEHTNVTIFNQFKKKIYYKVDNFKEIQPKLDRQEVKKMLKSGMKQIEIAKHFNASKGTISGIVKELKKK